MLLKLFEKEPNMRVVAQVIDILRGGGIIIYPTDTVYAMGCDIFQQHTVERVCRFKGIDPRKNTLSLICCDLSNISAYARVDTPTFKVLKRNLPGPFTFILPGSNALPKLFKGRKTVGIRVPNNNIVRTLVQELGHPLLSASVRNGDDVTEYETDPELIHDQYGMSVDAVIDGGYGNHTASTVVDFTDGTCSVVRQGLGILE